MTAPRRSLLSLAALAFGLLTASGARANDTAYGDENGTIVLTHQPDISMDEEHLFISTERIDVHYVFRNTSDRAIDVPVAFPMPPISFDSADHSTIADFKIWVDGKRLKTERRLVVRLLTGEDVSVEVARLGWRERDLMTEVDRDTPPPKGAKRLPRSWFGPQGEALFTVSEYFTWQQRFEPGQRLQVRHSYAPSVESGVPQPGDYILKAYGRQACVDKAARAGVSRRDGEGGVSWSFLRYVLTTGNNWRDGIKDFTLTVRKRSPKEVMSLCLDGELKKVDPVTFVFHAQDYRPQRDLAVLFVDSARTEP
ncbi:MAG: hypothetical protein RI907_508 [Pseudomonadota bacterium]|jgi:hypothetical protein